MNQQTKWIKPILNRLSLDLILARPSKGLQRNATKIEVESHIEKNTQGARSPTMNEVPHMGRVGQVNTRTKNSKFPLSCYLSFPDEMPEIGVPRSPWMMLIYSSFGRHLRRWSWFFLIPFLREWRWCLHTYLWFGVMSCMELLYPFQHIVTKTVFFPFKLYVSIYLFNRIVKLLFISKCYSIPVSEVAFGSGMEIKAGWYLLWQLLTYLPRQTWAIQK